jgi:tetratricopeptide (TPR) repeat protein/predicted Ser/Thr protein kinase
MTGERLGHYRLGSKLGEGGMGVVYSARDLNLGRDAAIKLLLAKDAEDPSSRRRLMREAKAASALNHPNIVTVYEAGTESGHHFIAMELVQGETLSQILHTRKLSFVESTRYAIQIAEGLECAHTAGLSHRDLKPSNIMVTPNGLVKLLDFGLAKLNPEAACATDHTQTALTQPGAMVGTLAYMAPEQARGEDSTPKTDIFSFGVVLFEMLTNARPFQAKSQIELFHEVLYTPPPPIRKLRPGTPAALVEIVERAVRKKPEERHASMGAVAEKLKAILRDLEAPARGFPKPWAGAAAAAALALTAAAGYYGYRSYSGPKRAPQASEASSLAAGATPQSSAEWIQRGRDLMERRDRDPGALDKALAAFESAIQSDPANSAAYAALAEARLAKGGGRADPVLLGLALDVAKRAVELNPHLASSQAALASVLTQSGKHQEAIEAMRKSVDLDPKSAEMQWRLAASLFAAQRGLPKEQATVFAQEAEGHYRRAIELEPGRAEAHSRYGTFLAGRNRFEEAAKAMEKARDLEPARLQIHNNLAAVYHMLEREDDAAAELQRSLEIRPTPNGYSNLGTLYYYRGKFAQSAAAFESGLALSANDSVVWGNLADACRWLPEKRARSQEAYQRAIQMIREKLKGEPSNLVIRARLSSYLAKSGANEEAKAELAQLEKQKIADHGALFHMSLAYEAIGQREPALTALEKSIQAGHPFREAKNDPELLSLRSDPRYHRMALEFDKPKPARQP